LEKKVIEMLWGIESQTGTKRVLIIDNEVDFCQLMKFYLSKKNCKVYTSYTLKDALQIVEEEKPELIIADKKVHHNFERYLNDKIDSIQHYYPEIKYMSATGKQPEGAVQYTLKKDYYKRPEGFWEKITEYIKDLFK
jgi:DNA-binding NtrC family response regulator